MSQAKLFVVGTPIGNLSDLSSRARETLANVSVAYAEDTRHSATLLRHFGFDTPLRSLHQHNEAARVEEVLARLEAGEQCAVISDAGTPTVSDPGARLVAAVAAAGFRVEPVPGPSAVTAALSASGLPADRFLFLGFAPRKSADRRAWLDRAAASPDTVVAFEAPGRLGGLLADWHVLGLSERTCVICRELTKLHEEVRHGTVAGHLAYYEGREVRGEITIVLQGDARGGLQEPVDLEKALAVAREMVAAGRTTQEVTRRLRGEFGMTRNDAYQLALKATDPT